MSKITICTWYSSKVLGKLLHKAVKERYQSAEEVIRDLTLKAPSSPVPQRVTPPSPVVPTILSTQPVPTVLTNFSLANTLNGHSELVNSVAISPDGQTLVSGSWDNTIKIWRVKP